MYKRQSNCVEHKGWNRQQQLAYLRSSLEGKAASVLWDYGDKVTGSLSQLTVTLKKDLKEKLLQISTGSSYETGYADQRRRMAAFAFSAVKYQIQEVMATDYFLDELGDPDLGLKIRERNPENLDAPLRIHCSWKCGRETVIVCSRLGRRDRQIKETKR